MDEWAIRRSLIKRLYQKQAFVHGHLLGEHLTRCVPSHERKAAKRIIEQLVREQIILVYGPTEHGVAYQLNIAKLAEIERTLQE